MNSIILGARVVFCFVAWALIIAAFYVMVHRSEVNGSNALAILGAAIASIGAIASWNPLRDKQ